MRNRRATMPSVSGRDDRCYWQIVPGAAKIWRVIGVLRVTPSIDHANVAALPLVNVTLAVPTGVAVTRAGRNGTVSNDGPVVR